MEVRYAKGNPDVKEQYFFIHSAIQKTRSSTRTFVDDSEHVTNRLVWVIQRFVSKKDTHIIDEKQKRRRVNVGRIIIDTTNQQLAPFLGVFIVVHERRQHNFPSETRREELFFYLFICEAKD